MAFRYDFSKPSDPNRPLGSMIEQAEDLLFNLRYRREGPQEVKRPIFFVCHSFGGLILKNVSPGYLFGLEQMILNSPGAHHCQTSRRFPRYL